MRTAVSFAAGLFLVILAARPAWSQTASSCPATHNVGYRIVQVSGGPKMALWYPTPDREGTLAYSADLSGSVARNAQVSGCERFPVIVFSHGLGGCGTQSVFLTEQLARSGYIVAAPDHRDAGCSVDGTGTLKLVPPEESFFQPEQWTDSTHVNRREDVQAILAWLQQSPDFSARVDSSRAAMVGHSLGGYTALGLAGAWPSWKDARFKAMVLLSPYLLPFLSKNRLGDISVPLMYQGAQFDLGVTPFVAAPTGAYYQAQPPRFFMELRGGSHFEWTVALCGGTSTVEQCLALKPNARLIVAYALEFLNRYVRGDAAALARLNSSGTATYKRTLPLASVLSASFDAEAGVSPESIVSAFSEGMNNAVVANAESRLPATLGNLSVTVKDSQNATHRGLLFLASPNQVNFFLPAGVAVGDAVVTINSGLEPVASGTVRVNRIAPSIYTADASGRGVAAAQALRVPAQGERTLDLVFDPRTLRATPIDLGPPSDAIYLALYGTGLRGWRESATATIGGLPVTVFGPVAHSVYAGLDQVNIGPIPRQLAGRAGVEVSVMLDGRRTNTVTVSIR